MLEDNHSITALLYGGRRYCVCDVSTTLIIRMRTVVVVPQEPLPRDRAAPIVLRNNSSVSSSGVGSDDGVGVGVGGATPSTVLVVAMINNSSNRIVIVHL